MNVTVRQLQIFVAVAKCRSYAEACDLVHLSQPALSISIKNLEEALGGKLLLRTTRSVLLTPEGEEFYPIAQQLLSDWEVSLEDARNRFALRRGRLVIAAMPTFASSLLPTILAEFHRRYSGINVTVQDVVAEQVVDMVRNGRVELGISFDPGELEDIHFQPLFRDKFVALFPPGHPLLDKARIKWTDLRELPFIALQRPSSIRGLIQQTMQEQGMNLSPEFEAHQLAVVGRMVVEGLGVSVIPALSGDQMREMGAVCRPIYPEISRHVGIISHRRRPVSRVTEAMTEVILGWSKTAPQA